LIGFSQAGKAQAGKAQAGKTKRTQMEAGKVLCVDDITPI